MAVYSYKAADPQGKIVRGSMDVVDEAAVVAGLHAKNYIPIRIQAADGVKVDDANVIKTDIMASNGVVHVIDKVIMPPSK